MMEDFCDWTGCDRDAEKVVFVKKEAERITDGRADKITLMFGLTCYEHTNRFWRMAKERLGAPLEEMLVLPKNAEEWLIVRNMCVRSVICKDDVYERFVNADGASLRTIEMDFGEVYADLNEEDAREGIERPERFKALCVIFYNTSRIPVGDLKPKRNRG